MSEVRLLDAAGAARYLGVSRSTFMAQLRQHMLAEHDVRPPGSAKPMPRWSTDDLDAWIATRRTERKSA